MKSKPFWSLTFSVNKEGMDLIALFRTRFYETAYEALRGQTISYSSMNLNRHYSIYDNSDVF